MIRRRGMEKKEVGGRIVREVGSKVERQRSMDPENVETRHPHDIHWRLEDVLGQTGG